MKEETIEDVFAGRTLGQMMADGAQELADDLVNNADIHAKYSSRNVSFSFVDDAPFTAAEVINARKVLSASQPVFAKFLGFSRQIVSGWEQGKKKPSKHARRILRLIQLDQAYWKKRFAEDAIFLPDGGVKPGRSAPPSASNVSSSMEPPKKNILKRVKAKVKSKATTRVVRKAKKSTKRVK